MCNFGISAAVISMLFFRTVLLTQISGMVQQSELDDKALQLAQSVIMERASYSTGMGVPYTPSTGNNVPGQRFLRRIAVEFFFVFRQLVVGNYARVLLAEVMEQLRWCNVGCSKY